MATRTRNRGPFGGLRVIAAVVGLGGAAAGCSGESEACPADTAVGYITAIVVGAPDCDALTVEAVHPESTIVLRRDAADSQCVFSELTNWDGEWTVVVSDDSGEVARATGTCVRHEDGCDSYTSGFEVELELP
jgi:hypothetical protein